MLKLLIILFLSLCLSSCFEFFDGPSTFIKERYNPQHTKKAILFLKGGNATMDNSLQVSVVDYEYTLGNHEVGNTFTVDSDHNLADLNSTSINLIWLTNETLEIGYDIRLRTFIQNKSVNGVTIVYESW